MFTPESSRTTPPTPRRTQRRFPILNGRVIGSQAGFTLIEVIVSLVLLGILVSMGGMAILQVVQGYSTTRENATITQQSQLAMSRITREIIEMINIPSDATATALPINNSNGNRTIGLDNGAVKMAFGADTLAGGDILIDKINAFTLTYYSRDPSSGTVVTASTWPATNDITTLTAIDISLQIKQEGGGVLTFVNRVAPRNNKNQGGAAPSVPPPSAPSYGTGCFVATAAYGDSGHPMVQILRDFRDRYLLPWSGGRWLVKQYYAHGPAAADLIRNRPLAMGAVRGLLAPVVALTFFLVYAPWALPVILILSLILTGALFSAVRRGVRPLRSGVFGARGSVLIVLIVTMVIMATLGAVMLTLFSASYSNQVYADQGRKTYYLAESGFRYAASQFLNAGNEAARLTTMTAMNNKTCNLLSGAGSFTTRVYPYWFKSQAASAGATTLTTQVYGTIPTEFTGSFSAGQIQVGSGYYSYTSGSGSGTAITFSGLSPALPITAAGVDVQPVTQPGSDQSLSKSGSLTLSGTGSAAFPLLNGNFILNPAPTGMASGAVFNYTKRTGNTLVNVTLSDGTQNANWTSTVSVPATTKVVLDKFIRLSSTGTLGSTSREVNYNVPVGWIAGGGELGKAKFIDQFTNDANWFTAQGMGTHTVSGGAMQVTSVVNPSGASGLGTFLQGLSGWGGNGFWGFNAFNWGNTNTNLAKSWLDAGGCLSYDLQVKVKNAGPYFFAGLGFRMANNSNSTDLYQYGVSFVRARQTRSKFWLFEWSGYTQNSDMAAGLIPAGLYPSSPETGSEYSCGYMTCQDQYSDPAIILWQRTGPATGTGAFKLLAYRILTASDGVLTGSSPNFRLKDWSSLMVRLVEGYELPFTRGLVDASSRHLKYGDKISNLAGTKTARVIGTPIITTNWGGANSLVAAGTLILTTVTGSGFSVNEDIYLAGGTSSAYARAAGAQAATKASYIMVYYSDNKAAVAGNTIQADNTRIGNARDGADFLAGNAWPPDDWTDRAAGLPTASPPGNDYFTLVKWQYLVTGSGLSLNVTPANGWSYSGGNLSRVAAYGTPITPSLTSGWTLGSGWRYNSGNLQKNANGTGTARPNPALTITVGVKYAVTITVTERTAGSFTYSLGGVSGGTIAANGTYTTDITATSTANLIFTPTNTSRFRITAVSVTPHTTAENQPVSHAALSIGTTYNVAVNVSSLTSGNFYYTIGGCTSSTCSAVGSCDLSCTASNTNPLTFYSPGRDNRFTISSISAGTPDTYMSTLDTTADGQGNVASFVPALSTTDLYMAVIKTPALNSKAWTSGSVAADFTGDAIALNTSGCQASSASSVCFAGPGAENTFYDDFGIQLDTKSGAGFLPPIQQ
ncbi:MAG: hypothetical protein FD159_1471 [Syntrophaceae bacterium]|nr:MAG: hypothetical protein FD159_1471 [Syntrophaceae bacterium]